MCLARDNPFRMARLEQLAFDFRLSHGDGWTSLLRRLELVGYRGAIVGPHGSGKTQLLSQLVPRLEERGFRVHSLFLNQQARKYPGAFFASRQLSRNDLIVLDGCEQLGFWKWRTFLRQAESAGGILVSVHRPGRLPTVWQCSTDVTLLQDLLRQLDVHTVPQDLLHSAFLLHQGNLRDILRHFYDLAASGRLSGGSPRSHVAWPSSPPAADPA